MAPLVSRPELSHQLWGSLLSFALQIIASPGGRSSVSRGNCFRRCEPLKSKFPMATTTVAVAIPRRRRWFLLFFVLIFVLVLLGALAVPTWLYFMARSALPQLDGAIAVRGLSARASVTRDGHGVPTIEAASLEDLFFAQGYVTAQDRLWQMDIMRRFAAGAIAEILGPDLIKHDRERGIRRLRAVARRAAETTSPRDRSFFEAYARGVNVFIDSHRDRLPIEFRILRYSPHPWT